MGRDPRVKRCDLNVGYSAKGVSSSPSSSISFLYFLSSVKSRNSIRTSHLNLVRLLRFLSYRISSDRSLMVL